MKTGSRWNSRILILGNILFLFQTTHRSFTTVFVLLHFWAVSVWSHRAAVRGTPEENRKGPPDDFWGKIITTFMYGSGNSDETLPFRSRRQFKEPIWNHIPFVQSLQTHSYRSKAMAVRTRREEERMSASAGQANVVWRCMSQQGLRWIPCLNGLS